MDEKKRAQKYSKSMDKPNQLNNPISGQANAGKRLAQRRRLMRAISQTYGQRKLAKEIPFIDELHMQNIMKWNVEHRKSCPNMDELSAFTKWTDHT